MSRVSWRMRDVVAGEEREGVDEGVVETTPDSLEFYWSEHNMACDENRKTMFERAAVTDETVDNVHQENGTHHCLMGPSGTQRYVVVWLKLDGVEVYSEA